MKEIDVELVKKYLNYKGVNDDFLPIFEQTKQELFQIAQPKQICVVSKTHKENGYYFLSDLGFSLKSEDINNLFVDCDEIAVMAVTLGFNVDRKISYYAKTDMLKCVVMDAVASVYIENILDELEEELLKTTTKYHTMRFSPGYGDLDLCVQKQLLESIDATRRIGISLDSSCLMSPLKSITALVGLSNKKQVFSSACLVCPRKDSCQVKCSKA